MMKDVIHLLNGLIELDYDAIEAYKSAIERLGQITDKTQLGQFLADHRRHVSELSLIVRNFGGEPSSHGELKQILTKGKAVLGGIVGEKAVFDAMKSNEDETTRVYDEATNETGIPIDVLAVLERNLADERRHRAWFMHRSGALSATPSTELPKHGH